MAISFEKNLARLFYFPLYQGEIVRDPPMSTPRSPNRDRWNQDRIPSSPD